MVVMKHCAGGGGGGGGVVVVVVVVIKQHHPFASFRRRAPCPQTTRCVLGARRSGELEKPRVARSRWERPNSAQPTTERSQADAGRCYYHGH